MQRTSVHETSLLVTQRLKNNSWSYVTSEVSTSRGPARSRRPPQAGIKPQAEVDKMTTYKGAGRVTEKPKGIGQDWRATSHSWGAVTTPKPERHGEQLLELHTERLGGEDHSMGLWPLTETSNQLALILKEDRWRKSPHLYPGPSISPLPMLPPGKQSRSQRTSRLTGSQRSTSQDPERGGGST